MEIDVLNSGSTAVVRFDHAIGETAQGAKNLAEKSLEGPVDLITAHEPLQPGGRVTRASHTFRRKGN